MSSDSSVERFHGMRLSEWLSELPQELETDAVSLWEIIPGLRRGFGLKGADLEEATRKALGLLFNHGAQTVIGCAADQTWKKTDENGTKPADIIDAIVSKWCYTDREPHVGDVWFALPEFIDGE